MNRKKRKKKERRRKEDEGEILNRALFFLFSFFPFSVHCEKGADGGGGREREMKEV
jgi:hypothetical protein